MHRVSEREKWLVISQGMDVTMYFSPLICRRNQYLTASGGERRKGEEYNRPNGEEERGEEAGRQGLGNRKEGGDASREADECQGQRGEAEKRQPNDTFSKGEEGSWTT